jgi:hypothetical protein
MKNIFKSILLLGVILFSSCDKSLEEVNIDPNTSPTARDEQVLTSAQGFLGYIVDVDLNSQSFLWAQYYTWGVGVSIGNQERFVAQPDDYDGYWQRAYANCLTDLKFLNNSDKAAFRGASKVLQAYIYQGLTDHFGSIPFSQAVKGEIADGSILTPTFDSAADVYAGINTMLDEAIADLSLASSGDMGAEDLLFGGDMNKWRKFANSLKLRVLMRGSEVNPKADEVKALIAAGNFMEANSDIANMAFVGTAGNQNPMFARFEWGVGDFYFASNGSVNQLENLNDPRTTTFYSVATVGGSAGQINAIDQGCVDICVDFTADPDEYSGSSSYAYGEANPVTFMSPWEVWFLRAEAAARYGTADNDAAAFSAAIESNFSYMGVDGGDDYASALNFGGSLDAKLDMIAVQKWISMNGTQEDEGWIEARRFDRPASRLFTNGIWQTPTLSVLPAGQFPATWLYPASERSLNPNCPAQRQITDKIFWDN